MISIVSKKIFALRGSPRLYQEPFDRLQEWLSGVNPMSPSVKTHDSGKRREIFPDLSPAGPDDIVTGKEDKGAHDNIGSGYILDTELYGGRADDGTGPGGSGMGVNHEQTYTSHDTQERNFASESDTSSKLSLLNEDSSKRDNNPFPANLRNQQSHQNLSRLLRRPTIQPRNRAAQSWRHTFRV